MGLTFGDINFILLIVTLQKKKRSLGIKEIIVQKFKEFCLKAKEFYKSNRLACTIGISTLLLFLSTFWQPFMIFVMLYLVVSMIFFNLTEIMCINFYCLAFSGFLILFIGISVCTFVLILARFIIDLCKKNIKIEKLPLILTAVISVVFSAIFYDVNSYGALQGLMIVGILFYFYIIFCYRKQFKARACCTYLLLGITVSCLMGALLYLIPSAKMFVFDDWGYGFMSIRDRIFLTVSEGKRLTLLCFHVNHLAVYVAFAITYVVYEYLKKDDKRSLIQNIIYCAGTTCSIAIGILTLSKAFLVIFVIVIIFTFIMSIKVYKKNSLKFILPVVIVTLVFCGIFYKQVYIILNRFFMHFSDDILNNITTGRVDIWQKFLGETFSSVKKALFGVGLFTKDAVEIGPHNLYVMVIYRFGIIGTAAIGVLVWSYIRATKTKLKYSVRTLFPLLIMLLLFMQEACVDERLYFFLLSVMLAFGEDDSEKRTLMPKTEELPIEDNAEFVNAQLAQNSDLPGNNKNNCEKESNKNSDNKTENSSDKKSNLASNAKDKKVTKKDYKF